MTRNRPQKSDKYFSERIIEKKKVSSLNKNCYLFVFTLKISLNSSLLDYLYFSNDSRFAHIIMNTKEWEWKIIILNKFNTFLLFLSFSIFSLFYFSNFQFFCCFLPFFHPSTASISQEYKSKASLSLLPQCLFSAPYFSFLFLLLFSSLALQMQLLFKREQKREKIYFIYLFDFRNSKAIVHSW